MKPHASILTGPRAGMSGPVIDDTRTNFVQIATEQDGRTHWEMRCDCEITYPVQVIAPPPPTTITPAQIVQARQQARERFRAVIRKDAA